MWENRDICGKFWPLKWLIIIFVRNTNNYGAFSWQACMSSNNNVRITSAHVHWIVMQILAHHYTTSSCLFTESLYVCIVFFWTKLSSQTAVKMRNDAVSIVRFFVYRHKNAWCCCNALKQVICLPPNKTFKLTANTVNICGVLTASYSTFLVKPDLGDWGMYSLSRKW